MGSGLMRKQVHLHHWAKGQSVPQPRSAKEGPLTAKGDLCSCHTQTVMIFLGRWKVQKVEESRAVRQDSLSGIDHQVRFTGD